MWTKASPRMTSITRKCKTCKLILPEMWPHYGMKCAVIVVIRFLEFPDWRNLKNITQHEEVVAYSLSYTGITKLLSSKPYALNALSICDNHYMQAFTIPVFFSFSNRAKASECTCSVKEKRYPIGIKSSAVQSNLQGSREQWCQEGVRGVGHHTHSIFADRTRYLCPSWCPGKYW